MSARNSAKALLIHDGKLLVNRCISKFGTYFALPGGGQRKGETLDETLCRELLEETGYQVMPIRLAGVYERVSRGKASDATHKIYFIFLCRLSDPECLRPTHKDKHQTGVSWMPLDKIQEIDLFPRAIRDHIPDMLACENTLFLGSERRK